MSFPKDQIFAVVNLSCAVALMHCPHVQNSTSSSFYGGVHGPPLLGADLATFVHTSTEKAFAYATRELEFVCLIVAFPSIHHKGLLCRCDTLASVSASEHGSQKARVCQ